MLCAIRVALAISSTECPANKRRSVRAVVVRIKDFRWRRGGRIDSKCSTLITKLRHAVWLIMTGAPDFGTLSPSSIGNSLMIKQSKRTFFWLLFLAELEAAGSVVDELFKMLGYNIVFCYSSCLILWAKPKNGNFRFTLLSFLLSSDTPCLIGIYLPVGYGCQHGSVGFVR
jgi:hypothetical protein